MNSLFHLVSLNESYSLQMKYRRTQKLLFKIKKTKSLNLFSV